MKRLREAKLYGAELVQINKTLVGRYNQALVMIGFTPTTLTSFTIDGMGWSPEVAEEKKDLFYLSHGSANPFAIIVTPEQKGKPVYFPHHSFDRSLMDEIFRVNEKQIKVLTQQNSICVDIDQNIDAYYNPVDLSDYREVRAAFHVTGGLEMAKAEQKKMVDTFFKEDNYLDVDLHKQLLSSVRRYGDLRDKNISLKQFKFDVGSFYTRAFDGIFIIRIGRETLMIAENEEIAVQLKASENVHSYHIHEEGLMQRLLELKLLEFSLSRLDPVRAGRLVESTFIRALSKTKIEHDISEILDSRPLYKKYIISVDKNRISEHVEFSTMIKNIKNKKYGTNLQTEHAYAVCQPHHKFKGGAKRLMWQLLGKIIQWDAFNLYKYDKEEFYKAYSTWEESQQEWAINLILKHNN